MGSSYLVQVVGGDFGAGGVGALQRAVEGCLEEVNRQMSHYRTNSELACFHRSPAGVPFPVSRSFALVTRFALGLSERSGGAFDPTLGPLINLWGFGERSGVREVPAGAMLAGARGRVGWRRVQVTARDELVREAEGIELNLSAVAKGFGVDEMGRVLRGRGLTNFYVSIAGEVLVAGHSPRGDDWVVGITAPVEHWREGDPMAAGVRLRDRAISTSGDYQNFFVDGSGRRMSHVLDPRTGWPVQHAAGGVSVVAEDSMTADGLATTLFVLGPEEGIRFIEGWTNAAALFLVREAGGRFRRVASSRFPPLVEP